MALAPLVAALRRDLQTQPVLHEDETPLTISDPQKCRAKKGYLWACVSAAGSAREVVVYDCCAGRSGEHARNMLSGLRGTLLVDNYAGYKALFRPEDNGNRSGLPGARQA